MPNYHYIHFWRTICWKQFENSLPSEQKTKVEQYYVIKWIFSAPFTRGLHGPVVRVVGEFVLTASGLSVERPRNNRQSIQFVNLHELSLGLLLWAGGAWGGLGEVWRLSNREIYASKNTRPFVSALSTALVLWKFTNKRPKYLITPLDSPFKATTQWKIRCNVISLYFS